MLIDIRVVLSKRLSPRTHSYERKIIVFACDHCSQIFERPFSESLLQHKTNFCSIKCAGAACRVGGIRYDLNEVRLRLEKTKSTLNERYGVDNPMHVQEFVDAVRHTNLARYNTECAFQTALARSNARESMLQRYSVTNPSHIIGVSEKRQQTNNVRYGVNAPLQNKEIYQKFQLTCMEKYGVKHPMQSDVVQGKIDWTHACLKRHKTMKIHGTYGKSIIEDSFYDTLCVHFGKENIKRQVQIRNWLIDFYVVTLNVYVQFDGVYWHGLDRPIEMIAEHKTKRDLAIHGKFLRDREQDAWFNAEQLTLVRITDVEFKNDNETCVLKIRGFNYGTTVRHAP